MSVTVTEMQQRVAAGLSMRSRAGYTLLLVASVAMTGLAAALLATEPDLPDRTRIAFGTLALTGVAWTCLASWVLARRHVLYAQHRIAASWLAIVASGSFVAGAVALRTEVPPAAMGVAVVMLAASLLSMVLARRYRAQLLARRDALSAASKGHR